MSRLALAGAVAVAALLARPPGVAAAPPKAWEAYGGLTLEAAVVGNFYLNFSDVADHLGDGIRIPIGLVGTLGSPIGAGYLAHRLHLDPRPALAIHGAAWFAGEGFLLGTLIDGRDQAWGLRIGGAAWTLGGLGAVAGAVLGARHGASDATAWFAGPAAGFVAGGIGLGGLLVLIGGVDGDDAPGQFVTGATVGLAVGLGAATALALRASAATSSARSRQLATVARYLPRVAASPARVLLTVGGRF